MSTLEFYDGTFIVFLLSLTRVKVLKKSSRRSSLAQEIFSVSSCTISPVFFYNDSMRTSWKLCGWQS